MGQDGGVRDVASELPWIVSADDHVVEPPGVWQDRLPAALQERGPRVVQDTCEWGSKTGRTTVNC